jgi:hypothetical protein
LDAGALVVVDDPVSVGSSSGSAEAAGSESCAPAVDVSGSCWSEVASPHISKAQNANRSHNIHPLRCQSLR